MFTVIAKLFELVIMNVIAVMFSLLSAAGTYFAVPALYEVLRVNPGNLGTLAHYGVPVLVWLAFMAMLYKVTGLID